MELSATNRREAEKKMSILLNNNCFTILMPFKILLCVQVKLLKWLHTWHLFL